MPSFGETLKRERELRQISLREIAEATKINLRYLDALERNEFRHLPGGVFNKGFIRAFAQYIGIDPEAMVESYLEETRRQDARTQEKEQGRRTGGEPRRSPPSPGSPGARRGLWLAVAAILVLAAVVAAAIGYAVYRRGRGGARPDPSRKAGAAESGAAAPAPPVARPAQPPPGSDSPGGTEGPPAAGPAVSGARETTSPDAATSTSPAPSTANPADGGAAAPRSEGLTASIVLRRAVRGSIACDGRLLHELEALPQGARLDVNCREFLEVEADDAGALLIGLDGAEPSPAGSDGVPLVKYRVEASPRKREPAGGTP